MNAELMIFMETLINIEQNMAKLYRAFSGAYPEDADFWNGLAKEEDSHARLLQSNQELILKTPELHKLLFSSSLESLNSVNYRIGKILDNIDNGQPPSHLDCFVIALQLEQSAGDSHLQHVMNSKERCRAIEVLQILSEGDHDHCVKIGDYMKSKSINKFSEAEK